jgi:zinc transporter, ZIP family
MGEAVLWAFVAASTLFMGAAIAIVFRPSSGVTGLVMAFGAGALISAVAYELVLDALDDVSGVLFAVSFAAGGLTFFVGDVLITRGGGGTRKRSTGEQADDSALAIVLGAALDGIPESIVLGLSVITGGAVSVSFLVATALSNLPEAMSASVGLLRAGWTRRSILFLWSVVVAVSSISAAIGYAAFRSVPDATGAHVQAFAAGAIITMLADTMMPEAFQDSGKPVGLATLAGFAVALWVSLAT